MGTEKVVIQFELKLKLVPVEGGVKVTSDN